MRGLFLQTNSSPTALSGSALLSVEDEFDLPLSSLGAIGSMHHIERSARAREIVPYSSYHGMCWIGRTVNFAHGLDSIRSFED